MTECFADSEEVGTFLGDMYTMIEELQFNNLMAKRLNDDDGAYVYLKSICVLCVFLREHTELMRDLVQCLETHDVNEEELKGMQDSIG